MADGQNEIIRDAVVQQRSRLLDFIRRRVKDEDDAEDILQDVFYQLTETVRLMEPIEQVANWLFRVARNKVIDWYRKKKPEYASSFNFSKGEDDEMGMNEVLEILSSDASEAPDETYTRALVWEQLATALEALPKEQRDVFIMHELEDRSFKEIAEQTGVTINTLISRKHYAVKFLREELSVLYDELINN
ncbi:MAG: RNA polymerase sigma factor [Bacteroidetes bacterium]|nr:RNA polymerase sigma factor [Bacteroidota bacterium]